MFKRVFHLILMAFLIGGFATAALAANGMPAVGVVNVFINGGGSQGTSIYGLTPEDVDNWTIQSANLSVGGTAPGSIITYIRHPGSSDEGAYAIDAKATFSVGTDKPCEVAVKGDVQKQTLVASISSCDFEFSPNINYNGTNAQSYIANVTFSAR